MICATVNSKGGVGKTTVSVHLADWIRLHGFSVVLVDCDAQRQSSRWLKVARPELKRAVIEDSKAALRKIPQLAQQYDIVVVDAPSGLSKITGAVLAVADAAFVPTGGSRLDTDALDWTVDTIKEIQKLREGLPQTVLIPAKISAKNRLVRNLLAKAKSLGFGITQTSLPLQQIYSQVAGDEAEHRPPQLLWQMGRSRIVREAALTLDTIFQQIFPEACEEDSEVILRLVTPKTKLKQRMEANENKQQIANG